MRHSRGLRKPRDEERPEDQDQYCRSSLPQATNVNQIPSSTSRVDQVRPRPKTPRHRRRLSTKSASIAIMLFVDQRGTGSSHPLDCTLYDPNDLQSYLGYFFPLEDIRKCRTELEANADLKLYTTDYRDRRYGRSPSSTWLRTFQSLRRLLRNARRTDLSEATIQNTCAPRSFRASLRPDSFHAKRFCAR